MREDSAVDMPSGTATFLFTDIEGSTQLLTRLRERYAELLAEHHRLLRAVFAEHGGQEIDNQGDSFFVAFQRAKDAVSAAAEIQRALAQHEWPDGVDLRVRIGLHTGEAHSTGERYIGLSVNRAARISALGHGGQVLVSQTTAQVVEDDIDHFDGLSLRDLGERQLKDIVRPVRIYQLDVGGLRKDFPPLKAPRPERRRRRRSIALVAAPIVAVGVAAALFLLFGSDSAPPTIVPDSLVRYDPETLEPTDVIEIGPAPDFVVAAGDYMWITHYLHAPGELRQAGDRNLTRVDTRTNEAVVVGGGLAPCGLTPDPSGDVWVANCFGKGRPSTLVRVAADSLEFKESWSLPPTESFFRGLAYGGGSLWISDYFGPNPDGVEQIDPNTGKRRTIEMPHDTIGLAWSGEYGDLWASHLGLGVTRFHAATSSMKPVQTGLSSPGALTPADDDVWAGDGDAPRVAQVPAESSSKSRVVDLGVPVALDDVDSIAVGEGAVWVTVHSAGRIWRIDPDSYETTPIEVPYVPVGVAVGDGGVWVTVRGP